MTKEPSDRTSRPPNEKTPTIRSAGQVEYFEKRMRSLFYSFIGYFLTAPGLVAMAALDSSLVFFLPLGIDFVLILLSARKPDLFWLYAILATAGSLIGSAVTYWVGREIGEHGIAKLVKPSRLERIQKRVSARGAYSLAALGVIPPPFPFTAFVLTTGALHVSVWQFFTTLAGVRLLRFGLEGALAARYGRGIVVWMKSDFFQWFVGAFIALAFAGTIISAVAIVRSTRGRAGSSNLQTVRGSRRRV
jgi:membrane protein YqaA with SNARE-associated domain